MQFKTSGWTSWDSAFTVKGSENGNWFLTGVQSYHNNKKEDRRFNFTFGYISGYSFTDCETTFWLNNWDWWFEYDIGKY